MPADEVTHGTDVDESRVRTGPRHAAPKRPLFTRFHMPAGKAIATVAMPTAVLVGLGFTSSLALADNGSTPPTSKSLTADEYKDCVKALDDDAKDASSSPSPSASESEDAKGSDDAKDSKGSEDAKDSKGSEDKKDEAPSASSATGSGKGTSSSGSSGSDSGSKPAPAPSSSSSSAGTDTAAPSQPQGSEDKENVLEKIGGAIKDVFTGGGDHSDSTTSTSPAPSDTTSPSTDAAKDSTDGKDTKDSTGAQDTVKDTADTVTKAVGKTVKDTTDTASKTADEAKDAAEDAAGQATASPSQSADDAKAKADDATSADSCPAATEDESGVDNKTPVADDPWYLNASSLTLKSADYKGVVEVKTANGTRKKVLKYVISGGTDIGDLHQTVLDKQSGKTYHVQAREGSTSTIRDGDTVMYTEKISGNLFGLIPVTFSPDSPPPLNIPLIYFTKVKVTQAGQFGGSLHVPGMHVYTTD
ncbi:hypothetical protein [Streptomyces sp. NPDC086787]|uniref:hypothetical protein n=1 Tax=Streptomyces sp. NPDC086787 TaxID=3365759 RepID=UPI00382710D5